MGSTSAVRRARGRTDSVPDSAPCSLEMPRCLITSTERCMSLWNSKRALLTAADAVIPSLVTERAEMRDELRRLNEASSGNVLRLDRRVPR